MLRLRAVFIDFWAEYDKVLSDMPIIFRHNKLAFLFYSNEGDPLEPLHIHARRGSSIAKFRIADDEAILAESYGFRAHELNQIAKIVLKNRKLIDRKWNEYFGT